MCPNATKFDRLNRRWMPFGIGLGRCRVDKLNRPLGFDRLAEVATRDWP